MNVPRRKYKVSFADRARALAQYDAEHDIPAKTQADIDHLYKHLSEYNKFLGGVMFRAYRRMYRMTTENIDNGKHYAKPSAVNAEPPF